MNEETDAVDHLAPADPVPALLPPLPDPNPDLCLNLITLENLSGKSFIVANKANKMETKSDIYSFHDIYFIYFCTFCGLCPLLFLQLYKMG
jgi:hypothetical protein